MSINLETNLRGPGPEHRLPRSSVVWEGEFPPDDAPAWVCLSKPDAPMVIRCYQATSRTCDVISTHGRWLLESCLVPRRPVLPDEIAEGWDLAVGDVEPGWSIVYAGHELWFPQRVLRVDVVSDDWQRVWTIGDDSTRHVWRSTRACDLDNGFVTGLSCDDRPVLRWLPEGPWWPLQTEPLSERVRRFVLNTFGIAVECPECGQFGTPITHGTAPEMAHVTRAGHLLRPGEPDYRCGCGHSWSVDAQGRVDVPGRSPDDAAADDDDPSDALDYGALSPSETRESSDFLWEVRECLLEEAGGPWDKHGRWGETLDRPLVLGFGGAR